MARGNARNSCSWTASRYVLPALIFSTVVNTCTHTDINSQLLTGYVNNLQMSLQEAFIYT